MGGARDLNIAHSQRYKRTAGGPSHTPTHVIVLFPPVTTMAVLT